jgi:hypothetical protein
MATLKDVTGESRKRISDALAVLAQAIIPEMQRQNIPAGSIVQLRMFASWTGNHLHVSDFFIEQETSSLRSSDAKRIAE